MDRWFYTPSVGIRDLRTLIKVYHDTVGSNGVLEMDFAIDTTGNVAANQAARYKELGDWIRNCYGQSIVSTAKQGMNGGDNILSAEVDDEGVKFDRVMIQEDLRNGQRVRAFDILVNGKTITSSSGVGFKRIILFEETLTSPANVSFVLNEYAGDTVNITNFAVFAPCATH